MIQLRVSLGKNLVRQRKHMKIGHVLGKEIMPLDLRGRATSPW